MGTVDASDQDFAIRRFCQARVKYEQEGRYGEQENVDAMELSSPGFSNSDPQLTEELQLVDSFLNVECYENQCNKSIQEHDKFDYLQQELESFSVIDDMYGEVPMLIDGDEFEYCGSSYGDDLGDVSEMVPTRQESSHGVDRGLHLVHLLLSCAEAMGCRDTQLANSLLNQIWPLASPWGNSLQRVAYCFAMGLSSRLSLLHNVKTNGLFANGASDPFISREQKIEAFDLLHRATPYISFGFIAANDAIYQAVKAKRFLHIVDLGMEHCLQWPSLIRSLAAKEEGAPELIRITGINEHRDLLTSLESSMKGVIEEANSLGIHLEFHTIAEPVTPSLFTKQKLKSREGEALFVNSIMSLHKFGKESRGSTKMILQAIKKLGPELFTVVEQDANHNGPFFLGRFLESLHYYSAVFDSLEDSLHRGSVMRMKVENFYLAEEIRNILAYEGSNRIERHETADQWRRQISRAGFQVVELNSTSLMQIMLSEYSSNGYTVAKEKACLLLGWKGRSIMLASAWRVPDIISS